MAAGMLRLAADFGAGGPPPPGGGDGGGDVDVPAIDERLDDIMAGVVYVQGLRPTADMSKAAILAVVEQVWTHELGPFFDLAREATELLHAPKAGPGPAPAPGPTPIPPPPPPPPPPAPSGIIGVCGSYSGHDPAKDVYLGLTDEQVQWGPHHGFSVRAPAPGTVQALTFPTPLSTWQVLPPERRKELERFFADFTCWLPPATDVCVADFEVDPLQTMYVMAYAPDGGFRTSGGVIRLQVGAHVRQDIHAGRVNTGDVMAVVWNTGIVFEAGPNPSARAAHFHSAPSQSGQLLPNGDMDGIYGCEMLGWKVQSIGYIPGPQDYSQPNIWCAGRHLTEFQQAGKPIPPMPS